nr:hypothetical protein [Nevskia sp.]
MPFGVMVFMADQISGSGDGVIRRGNTDRLLDAELSGSTFQIGAHLGQEGQKLLPLEETQALDGQAGQTLSLAVQGSMDGGAIRRQVEPQIASVSFIGLGLKQAPIPQAADQASELALVAARVGNQIAEGRPDPPREKAQYLAFHGRELMWPIAQDAVLLRAKQMHDRVDRLDHGLCDLAFGLIDNIN